MNVLIFILVSFTLALVLGLLAMDDPGYVLVSRSPYEIEISLALFVLVLVVVFAGLYLGVRFLFRTFSTRRDLKRWRARRNKERAGKDILQGYARLIEGDWAEAERELTLRVAHSDTPLLNHLGAAYAAQQTGDYARRDTYLDAAAASGRRFRDAIALTRARLQYQAGQIQDARSTIESMPGKLRKRPVVERMEAEVLRTVGDWETLEKRLPQFRRHHSFSSDEMSELEQQAYGRFFLPDSPESRSSKELDRAWASLPEPQRNDPETVSAYITQLVSTGQVKKAADQIRSHLHHHWDSALVPLFASLEGDSQEQIRQCMVWLEKHPEDARLLSTLAGLKNDIGEHDEAQELYAKAIRHGADDQAYLKLGELLERAGETSEALRCYRRGLEVRKTRAALLACGTGARLTHHPS